MFGLDDYIASFSDGSSLVLVIAVGILLGLRHATDPDHLVAVTTLIASRRDASGRRAAELGLAWGGGHALTLLAFGAPIVLFRAYLPDGVQQGAETLVGLLIIALAVWLLIRWRRGMFHVHAHDHGGEPHEHLHSHRRGRGHAHRHAARSPLGAFGVGCVHGMGGSAGVGVLLVATVDGRLYALGALALLAAFTALAMTVVSSGFGRTLARARIRVSFQRVAPLVGTSSLAFGAWYVLGALGVLPYVF